MTVIPPSHNQNRLPARAGLQAQRPHEVRLIRAYSVCVFWVSSRLGHRVGTGCRTDTGGG